MEKAPSQHIDDHVARLTDWRGTLFTKLRAIVHRAVPGVEETWKWRGVPVWEKAGIITTGETYPTYLKMTFAKGASLADPAKLFNASLEGNMRRAIDVHEGVKLDEKALVQLLRDAVALNESKPPKKSAAKPTPAPAAKKSMTKAPVANKAATNKAATNKAATNKAATKKAPATKRVAKKR